MRNLKDFGLNRYETNRPHECVYAESLTVAKAVAATRHGVVRIRKHVDQTVRSFRVDGASCLGHGVSRTFWALDEAEVKNQAGRHEDFDLSYVIDVAECSFAVGPWSEGEDLCDEELCFDFVENEDANWHDINQENRMTRPT